MISFFNNVIIRKETKKDSDFEQKSSFETHVIQRDVFLTLDKISQLNEDEFEWFAKFSSAHAKHNPNFNITELYNNFTYFLDCYIKIVPDIAPFKPRRLPTKDLDNLVENVRNMNAGLDRVLRILSNAKKQWYARATACLFK